MANYTSHKYKLYVTLFGEEFDDVSSMSVVRCPISNTASYTILNLQLRGLVFLTLMTEIENGDFPDMSVRCELIDMTENESPASVGKREFDMFTKRYKAIKASSRDYPTASSTYLNITIVLVHPVLLYLNNTNSYNKILIGKTGLNMIEDYEAHLKKTFGDNFEFKKIGETVNQNNHAYEQILVRLENDLIIPSWLIAEYKPNFTFCFYFFDDFRIDKNSSKDITGYFINIGAKSSFDKKSTLKEADDIFMANSFSKSYQLGDPFKDMDQENPSIIIKNNEMAFKFAKATGTTTVPQVKQRYDLRMIEERYIQPVKASDITMKTVDPTEETILYAPDTMENAKERLKQNSKLLNTDLSGISAFTLKDSHFDYIQFGINYILNPFESKEYRYTPIGIVNHFVRESGQFPFLIHNCTYQTIKFKAENDWG